MAVNERNLISLQEEMDIVETDAFEEERDNLDANYEYIKNKYKRIKSKLPYPDIKPYDTASDYDDIATLNYQKDQNRPVWDEMDEIIKYYEDSSLYDGHIMYKDGSEIYFMDNSWLPSRDEDGLRLINSEDKRYNNIISDWRYPDGSDSLSFSRNIVIRNRQVENVEVRLDRGNALFSDITDAYLRKALLKNKSNTGLKSIIKTIQKKQDAIRSLDSGDSFVVQGCAGSGKTMVLLHRLRYLLFNEDITDENYILLTPGTEFRAFISEISSDFSISLGNIKSHYEYYQYLSEKRIEKPEERSEMVFEPEYLSFVYSKEFIRSSYRKLFSDIFEQSNQLIDFYESKLNGLIEEETAALEQAIQKTKDEAVKKAHIISERVENEISVIVDDNYDKIPAFCNELEEIYRSKRAEFDSVSISAEEVVISADDLRILENPEIVNLKKIIAEEERTIEKASRFTVNAHKKKLDHLNESYNELFNALRARLIEEEKERLAVEQSKRNQVFEGVTIGEVEIIIEELHKIITDAADSIGSALSKIDAFEELFNNTYETEIMCLNDMIDASINLDRDGDSFAKSLEPAHKYLWKYVYKGKRLRKAFEKHITDPDDKKVEASFKLFADRSESQFKGYLYVRLFNICRKVIRDRFNISICNQYKHYWYIDVYCQYLVRGLDNAVGYIFIDEAQDLSPSEIELISKVNTVYREVGDETIEVSPVINLFGDINQMICSHGVNSWNDIPFLYKQYELDENFRNTNQIVKFCNKNLPFSMQSVGIDMEEVRIYDSITDISDKNALDGGTFIAKDEYAVEDLELVLSVEMNIEAYDIYTVKMAKGLEFKKVFVVDRDMTDREKYIAYTRPLEKLMVIKDMPHYADVNKSLIIQGDESGDNNEND